MILRRRLAAAVVICSMLIAAGPCRAGVTFLGYAIVDGSSPDFSGKTDVLEDGSSNGNFDGFGSGIAYAGTGNLYYMLADRGPNKTAYPGGDKVDNTTSYACRFQAAEISVQQSGSDWSVSVKPVGTSLLRDEMDRNFIGLSTAFTSADPTKNLRLDPESMRVAPDGFVYVSDEYGPNIYHFDRTGKRIGVIAVPDKFKIAKPLPAEVDEIAANAYAAHSNQGGGRVTNKGAEGLAITPDGSTLIAAMQCPLIQDGGEKTRNVRFIVIDLAHPSAPAKELMYVLSPSATKPNNSDTTISEIVAVNDHQLLVDERDSAKINLTKHFFLADITGATDISGYYSLSDLKKSELAKITPVSKSEKPFIDVKALVEPHLPKTDDRFLTGIPDKIEGLAFGPDLPDGRRLLIVTNDNDFISPKGVKGYPNYIFAFAIDRADLPDFQAERFDAGQQ